MTGFNVGLFYTDGTLVLVWLIPRRYAAKQILTTRDNYCRIWVYQFDIAYGPAEDWRYGISAKRWLHKRDDRSLTTEFRERNETSCYWELILISLFYPQLATVLESILPPMVRSVGALILLRQNLFTLVIPNKFLVTTRKLKTS